LTTKYIDTKLDPNQDNSWAELLDQPSVPTIQKKSKATRIVIPSSANNQKVAKNYSLQESVDFGYKINPIVFSCIKMNMGACANPPWIVKERKGNRWELAKPEHELYDILRKPNPFLTWDMLMQFMSARSDLSGTFYLFKNKLKGKTKELWILNPDYVAPVISQSKFISHYEYNVGGTIQKIPAKDIISYLQVDPSSLFKGIGATQAGASTIDSDNSAADWQKTSFENGCKPAGAFMFTHPMDEDQYQAASEAMHETVLGTPNSGVPLILGSDVKYQQLSLNATEMDYVASRNASQAQICAMYGVPETLIDPGNSQNSSDYPTAKQSLWDFSILPRLKSFVDTVNFYLVTPEYGNDVKYSIDISKVDALLPMLKAKLESAKIMDSMGIPLRDTDELLGINLDIDKIIGADKGYRAMNLWPVTGKNPVVENAKPTAEGQTGIAKPKK